MSYIALARKWRPRTFSQLVGQEHVTHVLIQSLKKNRIHHAYLFTGTRGVGKTSVARILAKTLNCERGVNAEPCLECDACQAIEQGRFIDLIEIDGASRTRVEDTRELLDNVQYAPTNGRFKIYLIDEVHMLSQHSFNALLKTLEEPPSHVKFLLATTDPQKLPVTVLSRCLQFNLKHVQSDVICDHLKHILAEENLPYETEALTLLSAAARGSVRDALSLLDQAIARSDIKLLTRDVKHSLGYTQQDYALQLLHALAEGAPYQMMVISQKITEEGGHYQYVIDALLSALHQMNVSQIIPNNPLMSLAPEMLALSAQFTPEEVQLFYQIGIKSLEELQLAPTLAMGFEMMLLRMYTFRPAPSATFPALRHEQNKSERMALPDSKAPIPSINNIDASILPPSPITPPPVTRVENVRDVSDSSPDLPWDALLAKLQLTGLALSAAGNAEWISKSDHTVILRIDKKHRSLFTPAVIKRIEEGLSHFYQEKLKLSLNSDETVLSSPVQQQQQTQQKQQQEATVALQSDPFFQRLQQEFSAELVKNSIEPLKDDL
jgi:DNA polymerase-3 subunit gamma/tau